MVGLYVILALLVGGGLGYAIAYTRFGNIEMIQELRNKHTQLQHDFEEQQLYHSDIVEQNRILKQQAHMLLQQNEDFSKMVSELSRYYYRIKQGSTKLKELVDIMEIYDEQMDQKLVRLMGEELVYEEPLEVDRVDEAKYF